MRPLNSDTLLDAIHAYANPDGIDPVAVKLTIPFDLIETALALVPCPAMPVLLAIPTGRPHEYETLVEYLLDPEADITNLLHHQPIEVYVDPNATDWSVEMRYPSDADYISLIAHARQYDNQVVTP